AGVSVPILAAYAISIALDIWAFGDWFIVLGVGVIAGGLAVLATGASPLRAIDHQAGREWGFGLCAIGAGSIAAANLAWLLQWSDPVFALGKLLSAVGMLAVAMTVWRIREIDQEEGDPFEPLG
ncbi:MAG: hypothetical protein HKN24_08470, partial [Acidimicrobiales bacterium]|nr:hypothetical protein [Acidimicrobiales bacterium]